MIRTANNIVMFPLKEDYRIVPPKSLEEVEENVEMVRYAHIQQAIETVVPMMFDNLSLMGFNPYEETEFLKDGALIVESIRSFLSKIYNIEHPLQLVSENLFEHTGEDGNLEISQKNKITITQNDDEEDENV